MATTDERMRILKMISEKQITAEEGARLLEALRGSSASDAQGRNATGKARWLRIRVTDRPSGRTKVNVSLPIGLVDVGLKWAPASPRRWPAWTSTRSRPP